MRRATIAAVLAIAGLGTAGGVLYAAGDAPPASPAGPSSARPRHAGSAGAELASRAASLPAGTSLVARSRGGQMPIFKRPGDDRRWRVLRARTDAGTPRVLLVAERRRGWRQVWLPTRPNGSRGWVRSRAVSLARDPWKLAVNLARRRLTVVRDGRARWQMRIAVGRPATPTPAGRFFVTELLRQPSRAGLYGPWAFGLSAHSQVLERFNGGDGEVGIHGTNLPSLLGRAISHGCIRLRNEDIGRLARVLPLGTPVNIRAN